MANTETIVSNLKINRLTQTQLENATSLSNSELYMVDPQFTGGKVLATDSNGDIVESDVIPTNIGTVKSVNSATPDSSGNVSLTIPTVNNPTITITQGGTTKGSFTLNQSSGDTINLDAGGGTATNVQINGTSITSNNVANILTEGPYGSLNKIATMAVIPTRAYEVGAVATSACAEVYPVVQKYQSGTSWYRIYSDGWCEMGGESTSSSIVRTVTFLKTFADTNYTPMSNKYGNYTGTSAVVSMIVSKTTSSMDINNANTNYPTCTWTACGYLAEGQY